MVQAEPQPADGLSFSAIAFARDKQGTGKAGTSGALVIGSKRSVLASPETVHALGEVHRILHVGEEDGHVLARPLKEGVDRGVGPGPTRTQLDAPRRYRLPSRLQTGRPFRCPTDRELALPGRAPHICAPLADIAPQDLAPVCQKEATTMDSTAITMAILFHPLHVLFAVTVVAQLVRNGLSGPAGSEADRTANFEAGRLKRA
jgi:hypothetical protein